MKTTPPSKPEKQLRNYLKHFLKSDIFQNCITNLRRKYQIPQDGIPLPENFSLLLEKESVAYLPNQFKKHDAPTEQMSMDLEELLREFPFENSIVRTFLRVYFFHNIAQENLLTRLNISNLCKLTECDSHMLETCMGSKKLREFYLRSLKKECKDFPVTIGIHPRASQRDVLSFVQKNWKSLIEPMLLKHDNPNGRLGHLRSRNPEIERRDDLIFTNRDKSYQEIIDLLKEEGVPEEFIDTIDIGSIGKVKSEEEKRRKEV